MTTRNPTSYTNWISERNLTEGKEILQTTPEQVFDDQEFALLAQVQVISDAFSPTGPALAARWHRRLLRGKRENLADPG